MQEEKGSTDEGLGEQASQSLFAGNVPIKEALNQLRLRLLDLTGRNRLVNFRHSPGKSLQFVHTSMDGVFRRLMADVSHTGSRFLPEPNPLNQEPPHDKHPTTRRPATPDLANRQ